jgi:hypothetical protein
MLPPVMMYNITEVPKLNTISSSFITAAKFSLSTPGPKLAW